MSDFCLLVTSRGRPENWKRLSEAIHATAETDLSIWLILDDDDPTAPRYDSNGAHVVQGPRLGHIGSLNAWALAAVANGAGIVGQLGDDHVPHTVGWDAAIRDALATPGIAYGDDLLQGENLPTAVFMSAEVIRATGKFAPEGLWHLYADNYWRDLGAGAGCLRYLPGVIIEHLHPIAAKADWDATYAESNAAPVDAADALVWDRYQAEQLPDDIAKVKAIL